MKFRFWGVRGSLPCPLTPENLKAKISSVVQRIRADDLKSPDTKERFLAALPPELFGTIGGNTTCLEVEGEQDEILVVDGGTGLRELGQRHEADGTRPRHYHIFLTHFHWDHIQGIPFFAGLVHAGNRVTFYSPVKGFESLLREQMKDPFFPVPLSVFPAQQAFEELDGYAPLTIAGTQVRWKAVNHPGSCISYRFDRQGRSLVFSTDTELRLEDFERTEDNLAFYANLDVLILDAQYTLVEAVDRPDWGHSSSSVAVDFALDFGVKTLYLFHHEPDHDDELVEQIGRTAQWYADHKKPGALTVLLAREGRAGEVR